MPPPSAHPVFDRAGLLERLMGDTKLVASVIEMFVQSMPARIAAVEKHLAAKAVAAVHAEAHAIKGSALNAGFTALSATAREMEHAAKTGDLELVQELVDELKRQFVLAEKTAPGSQSSD